MDGENKILYLMEKYGGVITTKEVVKNDIHRIYLTKLIKENKIYRLARGIYSNELGMVDVFYKLQVHSKKIIFSHFTSLNIMGYYKNIDKMEQISVPQGYNARKFSEYKVFYNSDSIYEKGIMEYEHNGRKLRIYDVERSVCDIIKDHNRFELSLYNKFINYYFNQKELNYKKLLEYSKTLNVSKQVHHYLSLFKA